MNKKDLLFYDAYEAFYAMAEKANAFRDFCKDAFGKSLFGNVLLMQKGYN